MKDLVIIGNGSFARQLLYYLQEYSDRKVAAFSVDRAYIEVAPQNVHEGGISVVPLETVQDEFPPSQYEVIMGIGYSRMGAVRERLFARCKEKGYTIASYIHPTAFISKGTVMGEGNIILESSIIQPFVKIGDGNLILYGVKVAHDDRIGNFNTLAGNTSLCGLVNIGNNCFLGNSCMIRNRIQISDYTLVGAGAIVKQDTKPYDVIVPARSIALNNKKSTDYL